MSGHYLFTATDGRNYFLSGGAGCWRVYGHGLPGVTGLACEDSFKTRRAAMVAFNALVSVQPNAPFDVRRRAATILAQRQTARETIDAETLTAGRIWQLLPGSYSYSFNDIRAALRYYYPDCEVV